MQRVSISRAWEETQAIIRRDGRLFSIVVLALVALPTAIMGAVSPRGIGESTSTLGETLITLIASLIAVVGQLALIRLVLTPGETVGSAIAHGLRRMPILLIALILVVIALFIAAIPFGGVLAVAGVPLTQSATPTYNLPTVIATLLYLALITYVGVRLVLTAPVVTAEPVGILGLLRRSWQLTSGNWWRLFGFIMMFVVAMMIVVIAIAAVVGSVTGLAFGPPDPLSASALIGALVQGLVNAIVTLVFVVMLARIYAQLAGSGEAQASVPSSGI